MKSPGVYRILCNVTNRSYIGSSSKDWRNRLNNHRFLLNHKKHPCDIMQKDWDEHGSGSFVFLLLAECSIDKVLEVEKLSAKEFNAFHPRFGYNKAPIPETRFLAGRPVSDGHKVRFTKMVSPEIAKRLADALKPKNLELIRLEHGDVSGWIYRSDDTEKRVGFQHTGSCDENMARWDTKPDPIKMGNGLSKDKTRIVELEDKVKELEDKIRTYEGISQ